MSVRREQIEELLEWCLAASEDGLALDRDHLPTQLLCLLPRPIAADEAGQQLVIDAMIADGLLEAAGRVIQLTPYGALRAAAVARRHRLTEVLLGSVLDVSESSMESTACQVEHILNGEVTEAVCAFLGQPPSCPHGRPIPRGACCREPAGVQPLLVPLTKLALGAQASVAFIHTPHRAYVQRLATFGLVPGRRVRLRQLHPALVVQVGETELALESQVGEGIFVRP